jgi:hypothetical protein
MGLLDLFKGKGEERLGAEEATARAVTQLLRNEKGMEKQLSYLLMQEIPHLTTLNVLGTQLKMPLLNYFVQEFLLLRVSTDRLGRREIVEMIKHRLGVEEAQAKAREAANEVLAKIGGD